MKKLTLFSGILIAAFAGQAFADGAALYQTKGCVQCHGKGAKNPIAPEFPKIAGQSVQYTERQMLDIKSGARSNANSAVMKGIMAMVTEAEIKQLADYLAKLK